MGHIFLRMIMSYPGGVIWSERIRKTNGGFKIIQHKLFSTGILHEDIIITQTILSTTF